MPLWMLSQHQHSWDDHVSTVHKSKGKGNYYLIKAAISRDVVVFEIDLRFAWPNCFSLEMTNMNFLPLCKYMIPLNHSLCRLMNMG